MSAAHGDYAAAVRHLETAASAPSVPPEAFYQLALAYRRTGQAERSADAMKKFQQSKSGKETITE
jgi:lipopolysaccharide biosynthesis regulator YciM